MSTKTFIHNIIYNIPSYSTCNTAMKYRVQGMVCREFWRDHHSMSLLPQFRCLGTDPAPSTAATPQRRPGCRGEDRLARTASRHAWRIYTRSLRLTSMYSRPSHTCTHKHINSTLTRWTRPHFFSPYIPSFVNRLWLGVGLSDRKFSALRRSTPHKKKPKKKKPPMPCTNTVHLPRRSPL